MKTTVGQMRKWLQDRHEDEEILIHDSDGNYFEISEAYPDRKGYDFHLELTPEEPC